MVYTSEDLHLCTFKTPPSGAVMSERGDADCAFEMCNGVKWYAPTVRWSVISKRYWYLAIEKFNCPI